MKISSFEVGRWVHPTGPRTKAVCQLLPPAPQPTGQSPSGRRCRTTSGAPTATPLLLVLPSPLPSETWLSRAAGLSRALRAQSRVRAGTGLRVFWVPLWVPFGCFHPNQQRATHATFRSCGFSGDMWPHLSQPWLGVAVWASLLLLRGLRHGEG